MSRLFTSFVGLVLLELAVACGSLTKVTMGVLHPRPTVALEEADGKLSIDVSEVADNQQPKDSRLILTQFRQSLTNGFQSMAGEHFSTSAASADLVLKLKEANVEQANIGNIGGYIAIRYRGEWYDKNGVKLASVAGVAEPRNPTETNGERHLEDVVEVMFGQVVAGLEKVRGIKTRDAADAAESSEAPATAPSEPAGAPASE